MTSSFRKTVEKLAEQAGLGDYAPCSRCRTDTLRATLGHLGTMCQSCYGAFCREPQTVPSGMADKRVDGPKAWAYALKAREESGERLSSMQRTMWRAAIQPLRTRREEADEVLPSDR